MTSQEMMRSECKPGYWFVNVAQLGAIPDWQQQVKQPDMNPNVTTLFGYDQKEFMRRQYK